MVNTSTKLAREICNDLLKVGVTDVVVCPGSRSAPLAWQLAQLASRQQIKLHTRIDEREAGFLALGIAKATRRPVPVVVTSGTAVANLLPAVVEAFHSAVPLVVLSADRPANVRGKSAPQTTLQVGMFHNFVKSQVDTAKPNPEILDALLNCVTGYYGPVHINAQFEMPLMPDDEDLETKPIDSSASAIQDKTSITVVQEVLELPAHGLLIVGDVTPGDEVESLATLAESLGYPIIWEPTSQLHSSENALSHGAIVLQSGYAPNPDVVISAGLVGLSRSVLGILKSASRHISIHLNSAGPADPDPVLSAEQITRGIPKVHNTPDLNWLAQWKSLDQKISTVIDSELSSETLTGPSAAVSVWDSLPSSANLFISPSWPVRHLEMYAKTRSGLTTYGNRGVNGIDGLISTAAGIASTKIGRTYLLLGDIAYLHGMGGLNISSPNDVPNLTVVVLDNDGSGIFSQLEQGAAKYASHFEQIFGTPHGKDLWVIAESLGIPATRVTTKSELINALNRTNAIPGMHVVVCTTGSRAEEHALITRISTRVTQEL